jgi:hypothetical protein
MPDIDVEIAAFKARMYELETAHFGKWIVFRHTQLVGIYASFEEAAADAVKRFGRGPYLIRQVGAPPLALPIYVVTKKKPDGIESRS